MTVKELSRLYWLRREVDANRRELAALEADIEAQRAELRHLRAEIDGIASPNMDGMPRGTDVRSGVEARALRVMQLEEGIRRTHDAMVNLRARISTRQTLVILERDRLEQYIAVIEDPYTRRVFTLRFVDGLTWEGVADALGERIQGESVKKRCYRYVREH